ncbi:MAG: IS6 family transposase [Thermoplasmata archaeon]|nr:MAG: IS6 family transposase [Thermoplasmata archaeon]
MCKRRFIERDGFENMTYPKEIITKVLHLYAEGLSLSKIRDFIWQHEGYYLYDYTIRYWVKKYSHLLEKFEKKLKLKVKGRIHMDEVVLKEKGKQIYDINAVDGKTGYNLEHLLTDSISLISFRDFFEDLKERIYDQCIERYEKYKKTGKDERIIFVSDGREHYRNAFNKYFSRVCKLVHGVSIACKKYGLKHNNNPIERYNEDVKQRYKVMRGFKSFESADAFLSLRRLVYNFVRGDETRAMKAGIALELERNRLLNLIKI